MSFDWKQFLTANHIEFVTKGANVGRNQINIRCPFCREADPSHHMTINLAGKGYRCYRNSRQHSGRTPVRLVQQLLGCTMAMAFELVGGVAKPMPQDEDVSAIVCNNLGLGTLTSTRRKRLDLPPEFCPIQKGKFAEGFWSYLHSRGYSSADIDFLAEQYGLHYAWRGDYAYRIIIPVHDDRGNLMTWTARSISPNETVRYKTFPSELAVVPPGELLLGLPLLWATTTPNVLVVCEGPFDALRISAIGHDRGIYGTCLFGLNVSNTQADILEELSHRFKRIYMLLDSDAVLVMLRLKDQFPPSVRSAYLPPGIKDPDELRGENGERFVTKLAA